MPETKPRIDLVFKDLHTAASIDNFVVNTSTVYISHEGEEKNINLDLDEIRGAAGHDIHPLVFDLYKIAVSAYMADLLFPRPPKTSGRVLNILLAVSDKSKWDNQRQRLAASFRLLTGDNFNFFFIQGERPRDEYEFVKRSEKVVSLFSGGLDSLSGVKYLLDNNLDPILISHCSQNLVCAIQTTLAQLIDANLGRRIEFHQISARGVFGKDLAQSESSQKSRSFLFLTLASIFALELGIDRIYLFENGILAMNLPIVPSRSFNNTKTAHPDFLKEFNTLLNSIYECDVNVQNPFLYKTKGEVVRLLDCAEFRPLIKTSVSCSVTGGLRYKRVKTSHTRHCGICVPCALRRFAIFAANLMPNDAQYHVDILGDFNDLPLEAKTTIFQTLDFGHRLEMCSDEDVFCEIPEFYTENVDPEPIIQMTRRYITEVKTCLSTNAAAMHRDTLPYLN